MNKYKEVEIYYKDKSNIVLKTLQSKLIGFRTNRISVNLLDSVQIKSYGSNTLIKHIANINVINSKMLNIQVWDINNVNNILKAIQKSNLGFNPIVEGQNLKIPIPSICYELKLRLSKQLNKISEENKIIIRNIRKSCIEKIKHLEKNKIISIDESKTFNKNLQNHVNNSIKLINYLTNKKINELIKK